MGSGHLAVNALLYTLKVQYVILALLFFILVMFNTLPINALIKVYATQYKNGNLLLPSTEWLLVMYKKIHR